MLLALKKGILFVLSGPSGAGKNTLLNAVLERVPEVDYSVSATTRPSRPGEIHGRNYFFLSPERFRQGVEAGEFLEWTEFCGHYYGTPRRFIDERLAEGKSVLMDVDIQGAAQIKRQLPQVVSVFLLPPSMAVLHQRLLARATEGAEAIRRRLNKALLEVKALTDYDYVVVNEDLDLAVERMKAIISAERHRVGRMDCQRIIDQVTRGNV